MEAQKPILSLIAAMAENRVIGRDNRLPWHLPADLVHFKRLTLGKPIVMGRKTWESLPGLLPERRHIVVTSNPDYQAVGCTLVNSLSRAIDAAGHVPEVMVVGGGQLYQEALPLAQRIYLTLVHSVVQGDAHFPRIPAPEWRETAREDHPADERNLLPYSFINLERIAGA